MSRQSRSANKIVNVTDIAVPSEHRYVPVNLMENVERRPITSCRLTVKFRDGSLQTVTVVARLQPVAAVMRWLLAAGRTGQDAE